MWIKIITEHEEEKIVYLPPENGENQNFEVTVSFGKKSEKAQVKFDMSLEAEGGSNFEEPLIIKLSEKLVSDLRINPSVTYQMKKKGRNLIIGPTIGLLLGPHDYIYSPNHMKKYSDRFGIYEKIGGLIYAFSPKTIDWQNGEVYGLYYDNSKKQWRFGIFPVPSAIYRRDFHSKKSDIRRLINVTNGRMFNSWRFGKFYLYKHVKKHKALAKHVPATELCSSYNQAKKFIDDNRDVILKPIYLSRGRGICIINKENDGYRVFDYRNSGNKEFLLDNDAALKDFFDKNNNLFDKYLIQKHLVLAKIEGAAYDIRLVMQKDKTSRWKCSGIECRVAAQESLITNISRGGYALTLDKALEKSFSTEKFNLEKIKNEIDDLCLKLCESLDSIGHHFAEFGVDIALDESGNSWIIEVNVFPSFKGFKVMDYDTYLAIRHTPILYAAHLAGF
ncbi:MAG: YheC/YheD family protein [Bacillota bacterium]|nr:YheC/YheD family protein [Bacillota bacterium]